MAQILLLSYAMSPIQLICSGYIAGTIIAALIQSTLLPPVLMGMGVLICIVFFKRTVIQIATLSLVTGMAIHYIHSPQPETFAPNSNCHRILEGVIRTPPSIHHNRARFTIQLSRLSKCISSSKSPVLKPYGDKVFVTILNSSHGLPNKGDTIRFAAMCQLNRPYAKSWMQRLPSQPYLTAVIPDGRYILRTHKTSNPLEAWLQYQRLRVSRYFVTHLSAPNAAIAKALTIGQRDSLTNEQKDTFRKTGTAHLLAVSGLHLGILALLSYGMCFFVLRRIYPIAARMDVSRICAAICIPVIVLFTLLTGANPPVVRAAVMFLFILTAKILFQRVSSIQTISIAACSLLSFNPLLISNAGFQLSFCTVLGFLLFLKPSPKARQQTDFVAKLPCSNVEKPRHPIVRFLQSAGTFFVKTTHASLLAAGVTSPLLAVHFQLVPLLAPVINVLAIPLVSLLIMPLLLITGVTTLFIPHLAPLLATPCELTLSALGTFITWIKPISFNLSVQSRVTLVCVCLASGMILLVLQKKGKAAMVAALLCGIALVFSLRSTPPSFPKNALTFDFLDVGQGDATLVTFPNGSHWLIDGGGTAHREMGRGHLIPILDSLGVSSLEKIILTHPDPDHLLGLPQIVQKLKVGEIWENGQGLEEATHPAYKQLLQIAAKKQLPVKRGKTICGHHQTSNVTTTILHPCFADKNYAPELSFNDNSIVTRFTYHQHTVLLVGDLSFEGENMLLEKQNSLSSALLKLGHHGSAGASSSEFLKRIDPKHAVASCGFKNRYNFPATALLRRLEQQQIQLLRTDTQGWIRYIVRKSGTEIQFQKKPH